MTLDTLASAALTVSGFFELSIIVKATAILTLGLLVLRGLRRARASRRHAVLAVSFGVLASLPFVAYVVPPVTLTIATEPESHAAAQPLATLPPPATTAFQHPLAANRSPIAGEAAHQRHRPSTIVALRAAWGVGALLFLTPVLATIHRLGRFRSTSDEWPEGTARANQLAAEQGLQRSVAVRLHSAVAAPMTFGAAAPTILLPVDAPAWSTQDLDRALTHEIEHVRRHDWPIQVFSRVVCAGYWCHPLIWIAWRQLHLEADRACDDAVVVRGEGGAFAHQLVAMAQKMSARRSSMIPAMANRGGLSARVAALLNPRQVRGRTGTGWIWATVALALLCGAMLSPLGVLATAKPITAGTDRFLASDLPAIDPGARTGPVTPQPATAPAASPARQSSGALVARPAVPAPPPSFAGASLRFDSASVTQAADKGRAFTQAIPGPSGNTFIAYGVSIESLVVWAYGIGVNNGSAKGRPWAAVDDSPVRGQPVMSDRFDIRARAPFESREPAAGTLGVFNYLVQALLADRFGLVTHWEARQRPIYVLHTVGGARALGPRIRTSVLDCEAPKSGAPTPGDDRAATPGGVFRRTCGVSSTSIDSPFLPARWVGMVSAGAISMAKFTELLSSSLRAEVVDATGLPGVYDLDLRVGPGSTAQSPNDALREQLGLWLEEQKAPGDVLVIDKVGQPVMD